LFINRQYAGIIDNSRTKDTCPHCGKKLEGIFKQVCPIVRLGRLAPFSIDRPYQLFFHFHAGFSLHQFRVVPKIKALYIVV